MTSKISNLSLKKYNTSKIKKQKQDGFGHSRTPGVYWTKTPPLMTIFHKFDRFQAVFRSFFTFKNVYCGIVIISIFFYFFLIELLVCPRCLGTRLRYDKGKKIIKNINKPKSMLYALALRNFHEFFNEEKVQVKKEIRFTNCNDNNTIP